MNENPLCHNGSDRSPLLAGCSGQAARDKSWTSCNFHSWSLDAGRQIAYRDVQSSDSEQLERLDDENPACDLQPARASLRELQALSKNHRLLAGVASQRQSSSIRIDRRRHIADVDENYATALGATQRSFAEMFPEGSMSRSEELIQELESADFVVIATPMHNFTVPVRAEGVDRSHRSSPPNVQCDRRRKSGCAARPSGLCRRVLGRKIFRRARASAGFSHAVSKSHPGHHRAA